MQFCEYWPIRLRVARSIPQATQKNYFVTFMYVKTMLPEPLDLFHMSLKFPKKGS